MIQVVVVVVVIRDLLNEDMFAEDVKPRCYRGRVRTPDLFDYCAWIVQCQ